MVHIFIAFLALGVDPTITETKLCDPKKYVSQIEPDIQYTEEEFNYENFRWAMDWFSDADWKERVEGKTYSTPFELGWEFEMMYFNRLTAIEGYALKLRALSSRGDEKDLAIDKFCTFVINSVPLD